MIGRPPLNRFTNAAYYDRLKRRDYQTANVRAKRSIKIDVYWSTPTGTVKNTCADPYVSRTVVPYVKRLRESATTTYNNRCYSFGSETGL